MTDWEKKYKTLSEKYDKLLKEKEILLEGYNALRNNWSFELFSYFNSILAKYKKELDPSIVEVAATHERQSLVYEIYPKDVVCVRTNSKKKTIYLTKKVVNIKGPKHETDQVVVHRNNYRLEDLCLDLDILNFRLVMVSDSAIVNVEYYHQFKKTLQLNFPFEHHRAKSITIGVEFMADYLKVKSHFDDVMSLQRLSLHGIG